MQIVRNCRFAGRRFGCMRALHQIAARADQSADHPFIQRAVSSGDLHIVHRTRMHVRSERDMGALAASLGLSAAPGDVFCLFGDLGVGKTSFARAFIRKRTGLPDMAVVSPTYLFDISYEHDGMLIHHLDLYRLTSPRDAHVLELPVCFSQAICVVEWPERIDVEQYPGVFMSVHIEDGTAVHVDEWRDITLCCVTKERVLSPSAEERIARWQAAVDVPAEDMAKKE